MKETENTRERKRLLSGLAALICAAAFLSFAIPCQAQPTLQLLHGHVNPAVAKGRAKLVGLLPPAQHLHLAIQLPLRNQDDLNGFLQRLYDPKSPDFRKYLSVEEFTEKYGPTKEDYQAVVDFVKANGMTVMDTPRNRMLVEVDGAVPLVEKALHVTMKTYQHPKENRTFYATDREPSLALAVPLLHISGLDNFSVPYPKQSTILNPSAPYPPPPTGSGPYNSYLLSDIRAAYYGGTTLTGTGQSVGLLEFAGYDLSDVELNFTSVGQTNNVPVNNVLLGGLIAPMPGGAAEPVLDIVSAMGMAPGLDQVLVYECCSDTYSGSPSGVAVILNQMASDNIAKQLSCSYGYGNESLVDDPIYEEMAAQGQTFFSATGDYGSPVSPGNDVEDDFYPSDDAWVTAVSMSLVTTNGPGGSWAAEIYAGGSGGGYSDGPTPTPIPSWQVPAINSSNNGSTTMRNVPDVVMDGYGLYMCVDGGCWPNDSCTGCTNGGSSWASPMWAGYAALVNQQAVTNGNQPVGFLNPALYSIGEGSNYGADFHDIIGGNNGCCGQAVYYTAVPGYDLVGGWGSPNGQNMIDDLLSYSSTPSFSLLAEQPASISIGPSDSGANTIMVGATGGFAGNVTLAASGLPSGVTASFNPNPTTGASVASVMTLTSGSSVTPGTSAVTVTGTSGTQKATTTVALTVTATPGNFTIGAGITTPYVPQSGSTTSQITVTSLDNFNAPVTLNVTGLPAGVTAAFSANPVTPNNPGCATPNPCAYSTLTLSASSAVALGTQATVNVTGIAGSLIQNTPLLLTVSGMLSTTTSSVIEGGNITFNYATSAGFNTPINWVGIFQGCVPVWVCNPWNGFLQQTAAGTSGTVTFNTATLTPGVYQAWYQYNGGLQSLAGPVSFTVIAPTDFTVYMDPTLESTFLDAGQHGATPYTVTISSVGTFSAPVALSISGLPSDLTASFSPNPVTPPAGGIATSTLTLTGSPTATLGDTSTATITGTYGSVQNTYQTTATVSGSLYTTTPNVLQGGNLVLNYASATALTSAGNVIVIFPHGVSPFNTGAWEAYPSPLVTGQSGTISISTAAGNGLAAMPAGAYDVWLFYNESWQILAGPVTFTVTDFAVGTTSPFLSLPQGGNVASTITITADGTFSSPVSLSISGLPSSVTASFSPNPVTPSANGSVTSTLTLTSSATSSMNMTNRGRQLWFPGIMATMLLAPFGARFTRARRVKFLAKTTLAVGLLFLMLGLMSCGGGKAAIAPVTPSTVTVTATSGTETCSTIFTLYIQ